MLLGETVNASLFPPPPPLSPPPPPQDWRNGIAAARNKASNHRPKDPVIPPRSSADFCLRTIYSRRGPVNRWRPAAAGEYSRCVASPTRVPRKTKNPAEAGFLLCRG